MKTFPRIELLIVTALVVVAAGGCGNSSHNSNSFPRVTKIHGSGVVAEEDRALGRFSAVTFATSGSLRIVQGAQETLRIRAEDNLLPYLMTDVNEGVLVIRTADGVDLEPTRSIEFSLTVADLESFLFTGVGDVEISDLTAAALSLTSTGVGTVQCSNLEAVALDVTVSGLGSTNISGLVDAQFIEVSGFGDYGAGDLTSRQATVTVNGFGSATVRVSDKLVAKAFGSGSIYYIGNPIVERTVVGSGRVVRIQ